MSSQVTVLRTTNLPANARRFSTDISSYVHEGWTVTHAALQVIYYMGFTEVYILGLDHKFEQHVIGKENTTSLINGADIDHFAPNYFGYGQEWDLPDLKNSEISFAAARDVFNFHGRNIFDCTIGGHCNIFQKMPFSNLYVEDDNAQVKEHSDFSVDLTIGLINDAKINGIENFIRSIKTYCGFRVELFLVNTDAKDSAPRYSCLGKKIQVINLCDASIDEAIQAVLSNAKGEFVQFVTPNCVLSDNFVDHTVRYLRQNPKVDFVVGQTLFLTESGHELFPYHVGSYTPNQSIVSKTVTLTETVSRLANNTIDSQAGLYELISGKLQSYKLPEAITYYSFNGNCRHNHMMTWLINFGFYYSSYNSGEGKKFFEEGWEIHKTFVQFLASIISGDSFASQQILLTLISWTNEWMKRYGKPVDLRFEMFDALFQINFDTCLNDKSKISKESINQVLGVCKQINLGKKMPQLMSHVLHKLVDLDSMNPNFSEKSNVKLDVSLPREKSASLDEPKLIASLFSIKTEASRRVLIDVGAHTGSVTQIFRDLDWKVYAFEPDPKNLKCFKEKFKDDEDVIFEPKLVLEHESQRVQFYASEESSGISSTVNFHHTHEPIGEFAATTLRSVYSRYGLKHTNFLKIDVEGADFSVLKGFPWELDKPDVILCEFEDKKTKSLGHSWKDICKFLTDRDYTVFVSEWHPIQRYGIAHDWCGLWRYPCELSSGFAWGNLIAFESAPDRRQLEAAMQKSVSFRW